MSALTGPADGTWVLVTGGQRKVPMHCSICDQLVTEAWAYYVGIVAHAYACLTCADDIDPKEVTMTSTAGITPDMLTEVALALEAAHLDWEQGKTTSPDTRDYVLLTERVLTERIGPEYLWLSDATHESVADSLWEAQCDGRLNEWAEMAEWLATAITTGTEQS